jgi:hypothetical protein
MQINVFYACGDNFQQVTLKEVNTETPHIKVAILFFITHLLKIAGMNHSVCILV